MALSDWEDDAKIFCAEAHIGVGDVATRYRILVGEHELYGREFRVRPDVLPGTAVLPLVPGCNEVKAVCITFDAVTEVATAIHLSDSSVLYRESHFYFLYL